VYCIGCGDNFVPAKPVQANILVGGISRSHSSLQWNKRKEKVQRSFIEPYPFVWHTVTEDFKLASIQQCTEISHGVQCAICNRKYKSSASLDKHMKKFHRKKVECNIDVSQLPPRNVQM
jgi:hypothetical protein